MSQPRTPTSAAVASPDHAEAQVSSFEHHLGSAGDLAKEHDQDRANAALSRAHNAFDLLTRYLRNRFKKRQRLRLNLSAYYRALSAAREAIKAARWGDVSQCLDEMRVHAFEAIKSLGGSLPRATADAAQSDRPDRDRNGAGPLNGRADKKPRRHRRF